MHQRWLFASVLLAAIVALASCNTGSESDSLASLDEDQLLQLSEVPRPQLRSALDERNDEFTVGDWAERLVGGMQSAGFDLRGVYREDTYCALVVNPATSDLSNVVRTELPLVALPDSGARLGDRLEDSEEAERLLTIQRLVQTMTEDQRIATIWGAGVAANNFAAVSCE